MAASIVASRLEARAAGTEAARTVSLLLLAGAGLQLLGGVFDPNDAAPNAEDWAERQRLLASVHDLEKQGDVIVTINSDVTAREHFQMAALYDIIRANLPLPKPLEEGLRERRYAAIFMGGPHEFQCDQKACDDAFVTLASNYFVAARRQERDHNGMSGFDARPRWIMRPRKHPLGGMSFKELDHRIHVEMGLAEARMTELPLDAEPKPDDTIEERAAQP